MTRLAGTCSLGLLLMLCASFCLTELAEADLHWHLLAGREILQDGRVPRADTWSHVSAGRPWVDLHWLFQVVVALVHRSSEWAGLDALKVVLITGAFAVAAWTGRRRGASVVAIAVILLPALVASQERFTLRPEAASFLLLAVLQALLAVRGGRPRWLLAAPPLLALWANLHALYAVGLALLLLTLAGDALAEWRRGAPLSGARMAWPAGVALAAIAATAVTPYGLAGWTLPRRLLWERIGTDNIYARSIAEFQAPFGGYGRTTAITAFALLAVLIAAAAWFGRRRASLPDLLVLGAFFGLALLARRNVPLFALVAIPPGALLAGEAGRRLREAAGARSAPAARAAPPIAAVLVAALALGLLGEVWSNRFYARDGTQRYFGRGPSPGFYPAGAADFVLRQRLAGEAIHDLAVGGFLAWRWQPVRRIFIDGRLEVHGEALFAAYLRMQSEPRFFEEMARRHGADIVVAQFRPEWAALLRHLAGPHGWRLVYVDLAAAVFVREAAAAARPDLPAVDPDAPSLGRRILEEIREARAESERRDPAPAWLRRLLPRRPVPVAETNAALFFGLIGRTANAELLFLEAIALAPGNPVLRYDLGRVLEESGRGREARAAYHEALDLDAGFAAAREALALGLLRDGDPEGALRAWERAERDGGLGPASLRARGALHAARGRLDEAIQDFRRAVLVRPRDPGLRADLAVLYQRRGFPAQAAGEAARVRALESGGCVTAALEGRLLAAAGREDDAERAYRDRIAADPGCPEIHLGLAALLAASGRREEAAREAAAALRAGADPAALSADPALRMLDGLAVPPAERGEPR